MTEQLDFVDTPQFAEIIQETIRDTVSMFVDVIVDDLSSLPDDMVITRDNAIDMLRKYRELVIKNLDESKFEMNSGEAPPEGDTGTA